MFICGPTGSFRYRLNLHCVSAAGVSDADPACLLQQVQVEWDDVNKLLQRHGFKPVFFADPVENRNLTDLVLLDKTSASELRMTLRVMLTDSERRQALVQELVRSNNQLKEEVQKHMNHAAQQSQRATELQELLDGVKSRVRDLEERCLGQAARQHSHTQRLQEENEEAQRRCLSLEQRLARLEEEAAELRRKLYFAVKEEEQRLARRDRTFQRICMQVCEQSDVAQQQILDVIDFYESRTSRLGDESRSGRGETAEARQTTRRTSSAISPAFQTILKAYQDQQKESSSRIQELKKEVAVLKRGLDTRLPEEANRGGSVREQSRNSRLCVQYHHLLTEINALVTDPSAPLRLHQDNRQTNGLERAEFQALLPTLDQWSQQLHKLRDLQCGLSKLSATLMPQQRCDGAASGVVWVEDLMLLVEALLENASADDKQVGLHISNPAPGFLPDSEVLVGCCLSRQRLRSPTRHTLASMVSHFQKLFDVPSLSGVYPRMNEVYTRLGEMTNALRNLRNVLDLDSKASPTEVVKQVSRLVSLDPRLGGADIDRFSITEVASPFLLGVLLMFCGSLHCLLSFSSIMIKVKQHDEFFPAFHSLVTEILNILGLSHLDDILPALTSLKQTAP
ncbi:centrosomal protein of 70 kDa isoform 2-T2 [Fundulus diaphanus]